MDRKAIPLEIQNKIFRKSKRRCALCFSIDNDKSEKNGQIAHLDQNNENNKFDNLVFLCLDHHDKYDGRTSQSKGYTKKEVKSYRDDLYEYIGLRDSPLWNDNEQINKIEQVNRNKLSVEVYDRKIKIYRAVRDFLLYVMAETKPSREKLAEFSNETDEAIFLFDQDVQDFISEIYSKAVRQRYVNKRLSDHNLPVGDKREALANEDYEIANFYSEKRKELKTLFSRYIYLE